MLQEFKSVIYAENFFCNVCFNWYTEINPNKDNKETTVTQLFHSLCLFAVYIIHTPLWNKN